MTLELRSIRSWEILDSRGNPTVACEATLSNGVAAQAQVPSGASTGSHEAVELRDGDARRYGGKGVLRAVNNLLDRTPLNIPVEPLREFERSLAQADGTADKSIFGANAMLAVSCAVARALAATRRTPLWYLLQSELGARKACIPLPMVNILSGGLHAGGQIEFQDFLAIPHGFPRFSSALHAAVMIQRSARSIAEERGYVLTGVADEGGWGPRLPRNEAAVEILVAAIERAGYGPGEQVSIAIDVASSRFYCGGAYRLEGRDCGAGEMIELLDRWASRYPIISIEDGLAEDDWQGWRELTLALGARSQIIGDDLFTTNPMRLRRGIEQGAANSVLVKMNQIGSLGETFDVLKLAAEAGFSAVVSARSGETEDPFLADLAVAGGAGQIKVGSINRSERLAKYNRLLELESAGELEYAAAAPLRRWLT